MREPSYQPESTTPHRLFVLMLRGRVIALSGEPLRKAEITLSSTNFENPVQYVATTDEGGAFSLDDVAPGQYQVEVRRSGYVRAFFGSDSDMLPRVPLTIAPGREIPDLDFTLTPQSVLTGRVLDPDGDPLEGVRVMLLQEMDWGDGKRLAPRNQGQTVTDDQGAFRIAGLGPGAYVLAAAYGDTGRHRGTRHGHEQTYPDLYYPDVLDPDEAQWINVPLAATLTGFELRMRPARAYRISGRVELPADVNPMSVFLHLNAKRTGGFIFGGGRHHHGGEQFDFGGVLPGAYMLSAQASAECRSLHATAEVEVTDRDVSGVVIRFPSGMTIPGVVHGTGALAGIAVSLNPVPNAQGPQAQTAHDGSFTLHDVVPGRYRVNLYHIRGNAYVKSVRYGGVEVPRAGFAIDDAAGLEIDLAYDSGTVAGVIAGAPGAQVQLRRGEEPVHWAFADQDGRFEISGVAPGEYRAIAGRWPFPRNAAEAGIPVIVEPDARVEIELKLVQN